MSESARSLAAKAEPGVAHTAAPEPAVRKGAHPAAGDRTAARRDAQDRDASGRDARARDSVAIRVVLAPIRVYQRVVSPALPRRCKYHPTCSAYAVQAIRSYGILRGSVLAAWRLLRCNPFSHGGYDPVTAQTLFRRPPRTHSAPASHS